jgi:hypothetical protein
MIELAEEEYSNNDDDIANCLKLNSQNLVLQKAMNNIRSAPTCQEWHDMTSSTSILAPPQSSSLLFFHYSLNIVILTGTFGLHAVYILYRQ